MSEFKATPTPAPKWGDLTPTQRAQLHGQADSHTWPMFPKQRQQELIKEANEHIARKRKSGELTTHRRTKKKTSTPKLTLRQRMEKLKRESEDPNFFKKNASGGSVKGRPAKMSAENS